MQQDWIICNNKKKTLHFKSATLSHLPVRVSYEAELEAIMFLFFLFFIWQVLRPGSNNATLAMGSR